MDPVFYFFLSLLAILILRRIWRMPFFRQDTGYFARLVVLLTRPFHWNLSIPYLSLFFTLFNFKLRTYLSTYVHTFYLFARYNGFYVRIAELSLLFLIKILTFSHFTLFNPFSFIFFPLFYLKRLSKMGLQSALWKSTFSNFLLLPMHIFNVGTFTQFPNAQYPILQ